MGKCGMVYYIVSSNLALFCNIIIMRYNISRFIIKNVIFYISRNKAYIIKVIIISQQDNFIRHSLVLNFCPVFKYLLKYSPFSVSLSLNKRARVRTMRLRGLVREKYCVVFCIEYYALCLVLCRL